jgi:hypothetical protein
MLGVTMVTRGSDLSGKCGACRRKVCQGTGFVACSFIGSMLALIVIRPYCLGTATPVCKPR